MQHRRRQNIFQSAKRAFQSESKRITEPARANHASGR